MATETKETREQLADEVRILVNKGKKQQAQELVDAYREFYGLSASTTPKDTTPVTPKPAPKRQSFWSKAGEALIKDPIESLILKPGVRAGQAFGNLAVELSGNEDYIRRAKEIRKKDVELKIPLLGKFNIEAQKGGVSGAKQIAGEAIESASNIALFAGGGVPTTSAAGKVGKVVTKAFSAPKAGNIAGKMIAGGVVGAKYGAAGGLSSSLKDDAEAKDIFRNAIIGGTIGGLVGIAATGVTEGVKAIGKNLPSKIMNRTFKSSPSEMKKDLVYKGKTFGDEVLERKIVGSNEKILTESTGGLIRNENVLQKTLRSSDGVVKRQSLVQYFDDLVKQMKNTPGMKGEVRVIKKVINEFPEKMSVAEANNIKRNLYEALNDQAFRLDPTLSTKRHAMKILAKGIRTEIEKNGVDPTTKQLTKEIADKTTGMIKTYQEALPNVSFTGNTKLPKELTEHVIDDISQGVHRAGRTDVANKLLKELSGKQYTSLKQIQDKATRLINPIAATNQEIAFYGRLQEKTLDRIGANLRQQMFTTPELFSAVGGGVLGGAPGVAGTLAVEKGAKLTPVRTGVAVGLDQLTKALQKIPTSDGKISRSALFNIIRKLTEEK